MGPRWEATGEETASGLRGLSALVAPSLRELRFPFERPDLSPPRRARSEPRPMPTRDGQQLRHRAVAHSETQQSSANSGTMLGPSRHGGRTQSGCVLHCGAAGRTPFTVRKQSHCQSEQRRGQKPPKKKAKSPLWESNPCIFSAARGQPVNFPAARGQER